MKNRQFVRAYERLMARRGTPVTPVPSSGRGLPEQVFRRSDGKTTRVRTNSKDPILMSKPLGYKKGHERPLSAKLTFEQNDYVAAVFPSSNRSGFAIAYEIPSKIAGRFMRAEMTRWMDTDPRHDRSNRTFAVRFDDKGFNSNCAEVWAEYCLGEIELEPDSEPVVEPVAVEQANAENLIALLNRFARELQQLGFPR